MPKGVEHGERTFRDAEGALVIYPLMPKGVEHRVIQATTATAGAGDLSFDAERR